MSYVKKHLVKAGRYQGWRTLFQGIICSSPPPVHINIKFITPGACLAGHNGVCVHMYDIFMHTSSSVLHLAGYTLISVLYP